MPDSISRPSQRDLLAGTDRWIPAEIHSGDESRLRRARNFIVVVGCGTLVAVLAGLTHLLQKNISLGIFAIIFVIPAAGVLLLFWRSGRIALALHTFLLLLEEARRCGRIVKSILKFARDEATPKWVEDLNSMARRSSEQSRAYVEQRGGSLELQLADTSLFARISPIDIEQVIVNLVRNAAESRAEGVAVRVESERRGPNAEIRVIDNGEGIDGELRSQVFDPFYTTRLEAGGSALGLSVAHGILGDHGGQITIETAPERGTCFRVTIPIVESVATSTASEATHAQNASLPI